MLCKLENFNEFWPLPLLLSLLVKLPFVKRFILSAKNNSFQQLTIFHLFIPRMNFKIIDHKPPSRSFIHFPLFVKNKTKKPVADEFLINEPDD
ncbi:hypothetical protein [Fervidibacillus halotolerans]|uniref:Uncharacterized protein n=1 Tax=Fervidibacillus halotolerans TaxID=2980027 RepID=A0A9E8M141_9BACI|nr:hypothetical protein [Fervidibacillus halotolerans]WAA13452.1 hypothetical protein OE105_04895 [Fervidibacillus halotolerans]